jgi:hypothetical protein
LDENEKGQEMEAESEEKTEEESESLGEIEKTENFVFFFFL